MQNFNALRQKLTTATANVNLDGIRNNLASNMNSLRQTVTNSTQLDTLRTKLNGYVPAPTAPPGESSSSTSGPSTPVRASLARASTAPSISTSRDEESGLAHEVRQEVREFCNMSTTARYQAFGACFLLGIIMVLLSFMSLAAANIVPFAVFYSFGNILSFASSFFLVGPRQHLATMSQEGRAVASGIAIASIILTLCAALWWRIKILVLIFAITQFCAQFWYCLTYIPYGRTILKTLFGRCMNMVDEN